MPSSSFIPADARQPAHNLEPVATGLLLGQDLRTRILPALGPGLIAYIDSPLEPPAKAADPAPPAGRALAVPGRRGDRTLARATSPPSRRPRPGSADDGRGGRRDRQRRCVP